MMLQVVPLTLDEANALVATLHRHHAPVVGHKFSIGAADGDKIVGAIGMADCRFVRCRFAQVAFTGDDALLAELEKGIVAGNAAMEVAGGDAA